jgi:hypothetical protein
LSFGTYTSPVLINGLLIACGGKKLTFLIEYRDAAGLALGCAAPLTP